jgi:hypothetical protein
MRFGEGLVESATIYIVLEDNISLFTMINVGVVRVGVVYFCDVT